MSFLGDLLGKFARGSNAPAHIEVLALFVPFIYHTTYELKFCEALKFLVSGFGTGSFVVMQRKNIPQKNCGTFVRLKNRLLPTPVAMI